MSVFRLLRISSGEKFPVGDRLYYWCGICQGHVPSMPETTASCECGNVSIDAKTWTLSERRRGTARLMRKIA